MVQVHAAYNRSLLVAAFLFGIFGYAVILAMTAAVNRKIPILSMMTRDGATVLLIFLAILLFSLFISIASSLVSDVSLLST